MVRSRPTTPDEVRDANWRATPAVPDATSSARAGRGGARCGRPWPAAIGRSEPSRGPRPSGRIASGKTPTSCSAKRFRSSEDVRQRASLRGWEDLTVGPSDAEGAGGPRRGLTRSWSGAARRAAWPPLGLRGAGGGCGLVDNRPSLVTRRAVTWSGPGAPVAASTSGCRCRPGRDVGDMLVVGPTGRRVRVPSADGADVPGIRDGGRAGRPPNHAPRHRYEGGDRSAGGPRKPLGRGADRWTVTGSVPVGRSPPTRDRGRRSDERSRGGRVGGCRGRFCGDSPSAPTCRKWSISRPSCCGSRSRRARSCPDTDWSFPESKAVPTWGSAWEHGTDRKAGANAVRALPEFLEHVQALGLIDGGARSGIAAPPWWLAQDGDHQTYLGGDGGRVLVRAGRCCAGSWDRNPGGGGVPPSRWRRGHSAAEAILADPATQPKAINPGLPSNISPSIGCARLKGSAPGLVGQHRVTARGGSASWRGGRSWQCAVGQLVRSSGTSSSMVHHLTGIVRWRTR